MGRGWLPERPLGRSTATTGACRALIRPTTSANRPSRGRARPVPNSASTTRSHSMRGLHGRGQGLPRRRSPGWAARRCGRSRAAPAASSESSRPPVTRKMRTSQPRTARWRAMASPSPPLLPGPQKIAADRASANASPMASTTPMAAFSISTRLGMPNPSMAARSTSRIASAVRILMRTPRRYGFWILDFRFRILPVGEGGATPGGRACAGSRGRRRPCGRRGGAGPRACPRPRPRAAARPSAPARGSVRASAERTRSVLQATSSNSRRDTAPARSAIR